MKYRFSCLVALALAVTGAVAQPANLRSQQNQQTQQTQQHSAVSVREFPTAQEMPADAAWRRDIYRVLDLEKDANASLYFPTMPQGDRMNLFTYLFKLVLRGQIKAYEYTLDGNEHFDERHQVRARKIMDSYEIYYEIVDGKMRVNDADLPSDLVKKYYIKESSYYDQHTATFRTKVTALCPVLMRTDVDFGGEATPYPMFWVNYEEAAPYLSKLMMMGSNLNNAATISADDYFSTARYEGEIYKTTNLQDKILSNYCPDDTTMMQEQKRIEKELTDFRDHVWGHDEVAQKKKDESTEIEFAENATTVDANDDDDDVAPAASQKRNRSVAKTSKPKKQKAPKVKNNTPSNGKFSVRRERH